MTTLELPKKLPNFWIYAQGFVTWKGELTRTENGKDELLEWKVQAVTDSSESIMLSCRAYGANAIVLSRGIRRGGFVEMTGEVASPSSWDTPEGRRKHYFNFTPSTVEILN